MKISWCTKVKSWWAASSGLARPDVVRSRREGEPLTPVELQALEAERCPDCNHAGLLAGPCGGLSQNFACGSATCGSRFNDMGPFGVERISDARPNAGPSTAATTTYRA